MSVPPRRQLTTIFSIGLVVGLLALLRLVWVDSDAYAGLTWNSELVTDEAFYCHDARNLILTGSIRVAGDNFHNSLIMPLLHLIQVGVFRTFGFSLVASRLISVGFSFITLTLFYAACRRAFGSRVAFPALMLLGFDHISLLYHRMALMDTPAQLPLVACFYAFTRAFPTISTEQPQSKSHNRANWMFLCGLMLMAAYAIRGLSALLLPMLLFLCRPVLFSTRANRLIKRRLKRPQANRPVDEDTGNTDALYCTDIETSGATGNWKPLAGLITGITFGLLVYLFAWYLPHRSELQAVNHFYVAQQLMPHSLNEIRHNIGHSLFGNDRGFTAYLFRHSPVQWTLTLAWLLAWPLLRQRAAMSQSLLAPNAAQPIRFLMLWMGIMLTAFALVRYSPPRYYVLFYPAMAVLAALSLANLAPVVGIIWSSPIRRTLLGTLLTYHLAEAVLRHRSPGADVLLYSLTLTAALLLWRIDNISSVRTNSAEKPTQNQVLKTPGWTKQASSRRGTLIKKVRLQDACPFLPGIFNARTRISPASLVILLWALINSAWLLHWAGHIQYTQWDCDQWLAQHLPANAVLVGDAAPGLTLRSHITPITVIPGLCNDVAPLESFPMRPCYIIVFESPTPLRWWKQHYPQWITPEHCLKRFVLFGKFRLALYEAQQPQQ